MWFIMLCKAALTFNICVTFNIFVDETLVCDHSNKNCQVFAKSDFFLFWIWATNGS